MSEILKYKKALNFRANPRYLRRDFIVPLYTGTEPDIVPETNVDPGMVVDPSRILPKNFTDDMPFVTDENNPEQLELAGGGSVERQEYAGGSSKLTGRYNTDEKKLNNLRQYLKSLPKNEIILVNSLEKKFDVGRGTIKKIVTREFSDKLKLAGSQGQSINIKKVNIEKAKRVEENISKIKNDYVKDLKTKFKYPSGSFKAADAGVSNSDLAIKYFGSDTPTNIARVERLNARFKNEYKLKYPKGSTEETSLRRLGRKEESRKYLSDVEKDILKRQESQKKLLNNYFRNNPEELLKNEKLKSLIDVSLTKDGDLDFSPRYKTSDEYIKLAKEGKLFDVFHTSAVKGEKRNIEFPVNRNIGPSKFNQGFIRQVESFFEKTKNNPDYDLKKQAISEYLNSTGYRVQVPDGTYIGSKVLPAIDSKTGRLPNIEKTLENLNLPKLANTSQYIPPKKISQFINNPEIRDQMIANIGCPTLVSKSIGGRVNFSNGSNCYTKGLEKIKSGELGNAEKKIAAEFLKEAGADTKLVSSLAKGGKNALRLFQELTVGTGPVGIGVTAALTVPFALADLSEGKRGSEALSNATFGLIGRDEEDILKGIGGPKVSQGLEIEDKFKRLEELENQYDNLENQIMSSFSPDDIMFGVQERMAPKMIESEKKKLDEEYNKTLNYLTPFLKKDLSSINPNAPGYKELLEARKLKTEEEKLRTEAGQARAYAFGIDDVVPQEEDGRINPMLEKSSILEKQLKEQEKKYYENQQDLKRILQPEVSPDDYLNEYRQYMSGGRVKLSEGSKGPKLSRRGFLGFLAGAASLPFVGKLIKGKKTVQAVKIGTKVLPKVADMPEWFNPLVTKIMNEGIDISPKATRVEDIVKVKKLEVPVPGEKKTDIITMSEYPDGRIEISADVYGGSFDSPFDLVYKPPKSDIDLATGKAINDPGEFSVIENRPRPVYSPDDADYEIDYEKMSTKDAVSDLERIEKIATGKRIPPQRVAQREKARAFVEENPYDDIVNRYGDAGDIEYDRMRDEGLLDEIE